MGSLTLSSRFGGSSRFRLFAQCLKAFTVDTPSGGVEIGRRLQERCQGYRAWLSFFASSFGLAAANRRGDDYWNTVNRLALSHEPEATEEEGPAKPRWPVSLLGVRYSCGRAKCFSRLARRLR